MTPLRNHGLTFWRKQAVASQSAALMFCLELPAELDLHVLVGLVAGGLYAVVQAEGELALFGLHAHGGGPADQYAV